MTKSPDTDHGSANAVDLNNAFALEEYRTLRSEALERIKMVNQMGLAIMTGVVVAWGTLLVATSDAVITLVAGCIVATLVATVGNILAHLQVGVFRIGMYLSVRFEREPSLQLHWETHTAASSVGTSGGKVFRLDRHATFLAAMVFANAGLAATLSFLRSGGTLVGRIILLVILAGTTALSAGPCCMLQRCRSQKDRRLRELAIELEKQRANVGETV